MFWCHLKFIIPYIHNQEGEKTPILRTEFSIQLMIGHKETIRIFFNMFLF